jgi:hypothetical protein
MAKKAAGLLKCETLAETPGKPTDPNAKDCVTKVQTKFDGGLKPANGCFENPAPSRQWCRKVPSSPTPSRRYSRSRVRRQVSPCNSRTDRHFPFVIDGSRGRGRCPYAESQSGRRPDIPAAQGVGQPRLGEPRTEDGAFAVRKDIRSGATGLAGVGGKES